MIIDFRLNHLWVWLFLLALGLLRMALGSLGKCLRFALLVECLLEDLYSEGLKIFRLRFEGSCKCLRLVTFIWREREWNSPSSSVGRAQGF